MSQRYIIRKGGALVGISLQEFEHRINRDGFILSARGKARLTLSGMYAVTFNGLTDLYSDLRDAYKAYIREGRA